MAKNKNKKQAVPVRTVLKWDDLLLAKQEAGEAIIQQQLLIVELTKIHATRIDSDKTLYETIAGLLGTLKDLAQDIVTISLSHAVVTTKINGVETAMSFKTGIATQGEEELDYISIGAQYLSIIDKVAHLAGTAYLDVFTKLNLDTKELQKTISESSKQAEQVMKDATNGK